MKSICFPIFCSILYILNPTINFAQPAYNLDVIGELGYESFLSALWGYTGDEGNEYAIVGARNGTSIVDMHDPSTPSELFFIPDVENNWREIKTFQDHAYVVTEGGGGLLIIDLSELPDNISTSYWTGDGIHNFNSAHTLFIDENGFCYLFGYTPLTGANGGAFILDLNTDPENPQYVSEYTNHYIHDGYVRNDTLWAAEIYIGKFEILDVSDKTDIQLLGTQTTTGATTHNCAIDESGTYLFTTDEIEHGFISSFDVSDMTDIKLLDQIKHGPPDSTIAHNTHYLNGYLVSSHYIEGVTIHDAHKPDNLIEVGYNHTSSFSLPFVYGGPWEVYPYFNSGFIIASDIERGLLILQPTYQRACYLEGTVTDSVTSENIIQAHISILETPVVDSTNFLGEYKTGYYQNGIYNVEVSAEGCITKIYSDIHLVNGEVYTLDAKLNCPVESITENNNAVFHLSASYDNTSQNILINYQLPDGKNGELFLLNITGEQINTWELMNNRTEVLIKDTYPPGYYFVKINCGNISEVQKLILY